MKRRSVVLATVGCLSLAFGLEGSMYGGAQLEDFQIKANHKNVQVILETDSRVNYRAENTPEGFAVFVQDADLAGKLAKSDLAVRRSNSGTVYAQAETTDSGELRILLPGLKSSDYAISVLQQKADVSRQSVKTAKKIETNQKIETAVENLPAEDIAIRPKALSQQLLVEAENPKATPKPRSLELSGNDPFEAIAGRFASKPVTAKQQPIPRAISPKNYFPDWNPTSQSGTRTLAATTSKRPATRPVAASAVRSASQPQKQQSIQPQTLPRIEKPAPPVSFTAISQPEQPLVGAQAKPILLLSRDAGPSDSLDPEALRIAGLTERDLRNLQKAEENPENENGETVVSAKSKPAGGFDAGQFLAGLPLWLQVLLGLFFGGIGLFTVVGTLTMLRLLWMRPRPVFGVSGMADGYAEPALNTLKTSLGNAYSGFSAPVQTQSQRSISPQDMAGAGVTVRFEDSARIQVEDFLMPGAETVSESVRNAVLVKFPKTSGRRSAGKPYASKPTLLRKPS